MRQRLLFGRLTEDRRVNRDVRLEIVELRGIPPVEPGELVFKRKLYAVDVAIVRIVNLGGNAADRRGRIPDHASQQARLRVEVERREEASWPAALHHDEIAIADALAGAAAPVRQRLLDLPRKRQLSLEPRAVELSAGELVLP